MKSNKNYLNAIGRALLFGGGIVLFFFLLEFTDKTSKVYSSISEVKENLNVVVPDPLKAWMNSEYTITGLVVGIIFVFALGLFFYYLFCWLKSANYRNRRGPNLKLLGSIMFLLWAIGWVLYIQAFLYFRSEHLFVNSELMLRSAVASLDLFMLDIDSNILDQIKDHAHLKGAIAFVCLLSFACTVCLLISLVSARLWAYLKLVRGSKVNSRRSHIYLFWGMNPNMELLAKSIRENDKNSLRVFIEKTKGDEDDDNEGWSHLKSMLTHRRESFRKVKELDARLALTSCSISNLVNSSDVLEEAGLNNIKKKIKELKKIKDKPELHLFFLDENEAMNIESVAVIREDPTIKSAAAEGVKVTIYCHARRNGVSRVIEQTSLETAIEVQIIDSAHLAVERLKMKENTNLQPVNFVNFNNDGSASSDFNALVVGFGEVGQDAVRFLYEYGAFVDSDKSNGIKRSPFCCHVVDPNMKELAPHYLDTHLRNERQRTGECLPLIALDGHLPVSINLHSYGYQDQQFINLLNKICNKLNYVVIAIGDDIEGVTLAVRILKHAMKMKVDLRNFKILLRSYSSERTAHVDKIVKYYNGLFHAEIVSSAKEPPKNTDKKDYELIHVFGRAEDIYSFESIVSNRLRKESWLYYNSYNGVTELTDKDFDSLSDKDKASKKFCSTSRPGYAWDVRRKDELEFKINGSPRYSQVMSVRRKEAQDRENALHRHTKRIVALKALKNETMLRRIEAGIRSESIIRDKSNKYFDNKKEDKQLDTLMTTLAQMEHLRWNASHQMLGYVWGLEKDEAYSEHNCLVDWDNLASDEIRGYDYEVVDRSFRLADEEKDPPQTHDPVKTL